MATSALIARLEEEARIRVDAVRKDADTRVAVIERATADAVAEATRTYVEQQRERRETARGRELSAARRAARARTLEATHAAVVRVLERARDLLGEAAASPAYAAALPTHVAESLSFLEGLRPRIRCSGHVACLVREPLETRDGVTLTVDDSIPPGILAEAGDGSLSIDNTLRARLERRWPGLASDIAAKVVNGGR